MISNTERETHTRSTNIIAANPEVSANENQVCSGINFCAEYTVHCGPLAVYCIHCGPCAVYCVCTASVHNVLYTVDGILYTVDSIPCAT